MDENKEILEALHRQVEVEYQKVLELKRQNDLAEKSISELQRNRTAEQARVKIAFDTNDKVSGLLTGFESTLKEIRRIEKQNRQIRQQIIEVRQHMERTDDILLLLLTEKNHQKITEVIEDLQDEIKVRRNLMATHKRNLTILRQQAAKYGSVDIPLELQNKIEAEEEEIRKLTGND
jgi:hypothetical protein